MKTFIVVSILLFTTATILGFKDFYNSKKNGLFKKLYKQKADIKTKESSKKTRLDELNVEDYSRKKIDLSSNTKKVDTAIITPNLLKKDSQFEKSIATNKRTPPLPPPPPSNNRKIKISSFSRGAIEEAVPYEPPIEKVVTKLDTTTIKVQKDSIKTDD